MGEHHDVLHPRIVRDGPQQAREVGAREVRALPVVDVAQQPPARGPREQHRRDGCVHVVDELGEIEDRGVEAGVEAVDIDEDPSILRREARKRPGQVRGSDRRLADEREVARRIGRAGRRPLDRPDFAVRRNGDDHVAKRGRVGALAAEQHAGRCARRPGRGDQHLDVRGASRRGRNRHERALVAGGAPERETGDERRRRRTREHGERARARRAPKGGPVWRRGRKNAPQSALMKSLNVTSPSPTRPLPPGALGAPSETAAAAARASLGE